MAYRIKQDYDDWYHTPGKKEAAEKSTVYLIGILILALKMALYQFFKFKSL